VLNNNLKKLDLASHLSIKTGFSHNLSKKIINDLIDILKISIKEGNFNLKNVGSFKIVHKNERIGRNPKTKKEYLITSRKSVIFTTSKNILERLNKSI
jgi:integration host factor subunit alpha